MRDIPNDPVCASCGAPADNCGLPVGRDCEFVANDHTGEWVGVPSCRACHDFHAKHGPAALNDHVAALAELRAMLGTAYEAWAGHADNADEWATLDTLRPFRRYAPRSR